jgi:hypothetical protein
MRNPPGPRIPDIPDPQTRFRVQAVIDSLPHPRPFHMSAFRAALEDQRGRPLVLTAAAVAPACTGLRIATQTADYIIYEQGTTPDNQVRTISHVIGHMVLDHQGIPTAISDIIRLFFPDLDPGMVAATPATRAGRGREVREQITGRTGSRTRGLLAGHDPGADCEQVMICPAGHERDPYPERSRLAALGSRARAAVWPQAAGSPGPLHTASTLLPFGSRMGLYMV